MIHSESYPLLHPAISYICVSDNTDLSILHTEILHSLFLSTTSNKNKGPPCAPIHYLHNGSHEFESSFGDFLEKPVPCSSEFIGFLACQGDGGKGYMLIIEGCCREYLSLKC